MPVSIVTDRQEGEQAFQTLRTSFGSDARHFPQKSVGWPSGSGTFDVWWYGSRGFWGLFHPHPPISVHKPRFWVCFGIDNPATHGMLGITVEINPAHEGINRHVGGAFLRDDLGRLYIAHTGKVGGGRNGVGMEAFLDFYDGGRRVYVPERGRELIVFGPIDDPSYIASLGDYVHTVARFKAVVAKP